MPNAFPLTFEIAESVMMASLGADLNPLPTLSNDLSIKTCDHVVDSAKKSFAIEDIM